MLNCAIVLDDLDPKQLLIDKEKEDVYGFILQPYVEITC